MRSDFQPVTSGHDHHFVPYPVTRCFICCIIEPFVTFHEDHIYRHAKVMMDSLKSGMKPELTAAGLEGLRRKQTNNQPDLVELMPEELPKNFPG